MAGGEKGLLGGARDGVLEENTQTFKVVSKQCPPDLGRQSRAIHRALERQPGRGVSVRTEEKGTPQSLQTGWGMGTKEGANPSLHPQPSHRQR